VVALLLAAVASGTAFAQRTFMPNDSPDLHGNAPDTAPVALLLIDVINDMEFDGGDALFLHALPMSEKLAQLRSRAKRAGVPTIYINDNWGKWHSDLNALLKHCLEDDVRGKPIVQRLKPDDDDYFVLKPKSSGFYGTTLDLLLAHLKTKTVILTGVAGNICVQFTANDAYMRGLNIIVPADCIASNDRERNERALEEMRDVLKAQTPARGADLDLAALMQEGDDQP
jgi:nicotinamidase-related amidase